MISCLWPMVITGVILGQNIYLKSPFSKLAIHAELFLWKTWSFAVQVSLFRLAWKGKLEMVKYVIKSTKISVSLLIGTLTLILAKSASMLYNYPGIIRSVGMPNVPRTQQMIQYSYPFNIYHMIACIIIIYHQCAWFCWWAEKFETFTEKLETSTNWKTDIKLLEKLYIEYRELCKSVDNFSSDYEVINSFGIMALFLNASFTGYFLLIIPTLTDFYDQSIIQYFVTSLTVIVILLLSFFAAIHHLDKKVYFFI